MTTDILSYAILEFVTSTGLLLFLICISTVVLWKKKNELRKLWCSILCSGVLTLLLKFLIQRQRPLMPEYFFANIPDYSFPSLHTALAFAIIPFFWKDSLKYKYLFLLFAWIIAGSRIYFQEHYWSDVLAGALLGYCIGLFIQKRK